MECRMENNNEHKVRKTEQKTVHNSTCPWSERNITTQLLLIHVLQLDRFSEREIVSFTYDKLFTVAVHSVYTTQLPVMGSWLAVELRKHHGQPQ